MSRHIMLLECGHWTYESAPEGFVQVEGAPRVCAHFADGRAAHASGLTGEDRWELSDQGLPLVPVLHYLPDPRPCPYEDLHKPDEDCWVCTPAGSAR